MPEQASPPDHRQRVQAFHDSFEGIRSQVHRIIVGQPDVVESVLMAVVAGGHVLLEGVPGLGKTVLEKTLSRVLDLSFSRIQFTPDLMPADITGTHIVVDQENGRRGFRFEAGPIFAHLVLADEINRATPKTQSALLEAMQEHSVTVGGEMRTLPEPFFVMATQNPIEMEGTYPLPEAQVDRFLFKIIVPFPSPAELVTIIERTTTATGIEVEKAVDGPGILEMRRLAREVTMVSGVAEYIARLVTATHPGSPDAPPKVRRFVRYGSSPRGAQALALAARVRALRQGRFNVSYDDVAWVAPAALRHRLLRNFEGEAEGVTQDAIVHELLEGVSRVAAAR